MTKNFNDWFHEGYVPENDYADMLRKFMADEGKSHDPMYLMHLIIDYHYAYMSQKDYIAQLEGKVYSLENTLDGPPDPLTPSELVDM